MKYLIIFFICCVSLITKTYAQEEGAFISVKASPRVSISGYPMEFSGNTTIGNEVLPVSLTITSPDGKVTDLKTTTDKKGDYKITYNKAYATGQYIITAKTADEKGEASDTFNVTTVSGVANNIQNDLFKSTETIQKALDAVAEAMDLLPSRPDFEAQKAKLNSYKKKLNELKVEEEKGAMAIKELVRKIGPPGQVNVITDIPHPELFLNPLIEANKEIAKKLPALEAKAAEIKNKSQICEMINDMVEVCGFVSLVLDFKTKVWKTLALNLLSDKIFPGGLDRMFINGDAAANETWKFGINSAQKTVIAAAGGNAGMATFIGTGFSLDIGSYIGKIMYAGYCEDLKGDFKTTFKATFLAANEKEWWVYDVNLKGEMKLRYKKNTDLSKGTEITGEFTGYRVKYGINEDFQQVEKVPYGMTLLKALRFSPAAVDANYFNNDLGAIAMAGIPGSFRVKVKGIVNNKNELRLQVIESALDVETVEKNTLWVIMINGMLPIPIIKKFEIPIAKNRVMFTAVLKDQVYHLVQDKEIVNVEVKDQKTKLLLPAVIVETKHSMSLSNKDSKTNSSKIF